MNPVIKYKSSASKFATIKNSSGTITDFLFSGSYYFDSIRLVI